MSLVDELPLHTVVAIDSAAFIYFIEEHPVYAPLLASLFEQRLEQNENRAITSVVALAEVLVQPLRANRHDLVEKYRAFLVHGPNLTLADLTPAIAERAAALRARHNVRLPDAFQLAAALEHGASHFITNDTRLKKITDLRVLALDDYVRP